MSETMNPLDQVVADAVDDAALDTTTLDAGTDVDTTQTDVSPDQVASPGADAVDPAVDPAQQDDFEKEWGIPARSITGRENRVPHTRVREMVTKADKKGYERALKEYEGKSAPQLTEFQTKVKDYEGRLEKVAQFEHVLENDPKTFLQLLSQIPAYKEFFDYVGQLAKGAAAQPQGPAKPTLDHSDMPQPDQVLSDGSKVYSLEGLAQRDEWLARKIEERAVRQAEERFGQRLQPIEQERQQAQRYQQTVQVIERQISDARTWPNFTELEPKIVQILKADPQISLERAYVKAYQDEVVPRHVTDRNKMRTDILAELRQKPVASSGPSGQVRPGAAQQGNRSMDQVIMDALKNDGLL